MIFSYTRPDKTGYWLWKIPETACFSVDYFDIENKKVYSGSVSNFYEPLDVWYDIFDSKPFMTFYIGDVK